MSMGIPGGIILTSLNKKGPWVNKKECYWSGEKTYSNNKHYVKFKVNLVRGKHKEARCAQHKAEPLSFIKRGRL